MSLIENNTDSAADSLLQLRGEHFSLSKLFPLASFLPSLGKTLLKLISCYIFWHKSAIFFFLFSCATLAATLGNRMWLNDETAPPGWWLYKTRSWFLLEVLLPVKILSPLKQNVGWCSLRASLTFLRCLQTWHLWLLSAMNRNKTYEWLFGFHLAFSTSYMPAESLRLVIVTWWTGTSRPFLAECCLCSQDCLFIVSTCEFSVTAAVWP